MTIRTSILHNHTKRSVAAIQAPTTVPRIQAPAAAAGGQVLQQRAAAEARKRLRRPGGGAAAARWAAAPAAAAMAAPAASHAYLIMEIVTEDILSGRTRRAAGIKLACGLPAISCSAEGWCRMPCPLLTAMKTAKPNLYNLNLRTSSAASETDDATEGARPGGCAAGGDTWRCHGAVAACCAKAGRASSAGCGRSQGCNQGMVQRQQ